jgi:hypothetical protein
MYRNIIASESTYVCLLCLQVQPQYFAGLTITQARTAQSSAMPLGGTNCCCQNTSGILHRRTRSHAAFLRTSADPHSNVDYYVRMYSPGVERGSLRVIGWVGSVLDRSPAVPPPQPTQSAWQIDCRCMAKEMLLGTHGQFAPHTHTHTHTHTPTHYLGTKGGSCSEITW